MLIEARLANERKSTGVAYLLWFFLGGLGAHRFYLGRPGTAVIQILLLLTGIFLLVPLVFWGIWLLVDLFLIPGMISGDLAARRAQLAGEYSALRIAD
ncbi:TM2 domain-containing protein [Rhodobacter sp. SGA-6-6]|nr:TM2 domain-containing protein [Rhodobacter sp. SGA-6-6]